MTAVFYWRFLAGIPADLGLCGLIVVFWTVRVRIDYFYGSHDDWPEGVEYVVGHAMPTSLFLLLILIYAGSITVHVVLCTTTAVFSSCWSGSAWIPLR